MDEITRVLVAEGNSARRAALCLALERGGLLAEAAADGGEALERATALSPRGLLLSMTLPGLDGFAVLETLADLPLRQCPTVLAVTALGPGSEARALALGADQVLRAPASVQAAAEALFALLQKPDSALAERQSQARLPRARVLLETLGMSPGLKGFGYLAVCAARCSADQSLLRETTSRLYPRVAREAQTTPEAVERAIRHAIESTWTHGAVDRLNALFGNSIDPQRGKPTNTECIARLSQRVLERLEGEQ